MVEVRVMKTRFSPGIVVERLKRDTFRPSRVRLAPLRYPGETVSIVIILTTVRFYRLKKFQKIISRELIDPPELA